MSQKAVGIDLVARAGIRAGAEDLDRVAKDGWRGWVTWQLAMSADDETVVRDALNTARLKIEYQSEEGLPALAEERLLVNLEKPIAEIWHLGDFQKKIPWEERIRPAREVVAATIIRATLSAAQLRESVVDFWRDHFSVNRDADEDVSIGLPTFDRDVLRRHSFGNFREMLEAVASSTAMLSYLNNASSKASPANENYARELLELHSLGAGAYFNDKFDRWRDVPGALSGAPEGYIDQDVYETARAFTGWTYADGQYISEGVEAPRTGEFHYTEAWHDPYQKRILATEFDAHLAPLEDGRKALDLVAFHPATAHHLATKLCRRFVSDVPSPELIVKIAVVFTENAKAKDQIARTLDVLLMSTEFAEAKPRLQRPLFYFASLQRSTGVMLLPASDHDYMISGMGQRLYAWHTPAGHPQHSGYWQSPGLLVRRWRATGDAWRMLLEKSPYQEWASLQDFSTHWGGLLGASETSVSRATKLLQKEFGEEDRKVSLHPDERWTTVQALSLLSAAPEYQTV